MIVMERRRKKWAKDAQRKLDTRQRKTYHTGPIEPADDTTQRSATAVPQVYVSPRERYVEHSIRPAMLSICLREPKLRDRRPVITVDHGTVSYIDHCTDWLTARAECGPAIEDETAEWAADMEEDRDAKEHPMIAVRAAMGEHARVKHLRRIHRLTGEHIDDSGMTPADLYQLILEIKCFLVSAHNASQH